MDALFELLIDPFRYGFMIRGLLVSVLVGVTCPIIGAYVITRNLAFMGDALAHAVLPGLVVGLLLGVASFLAALPVGLGIAILIGYLSRRTGISEDTSIGILFAGMFALGLVLISMNSRTLGVDVEDLLIGQLFGVTIVDVYLSLGLTLLVVLSLYLLHGRLAFTSFDPIGAKVVGIQTAILDYCLFVLLALVIVVGIQAVGIVLVMAMLVTPAATSYLLARRFSTIMIMGGIIGIVSAVSGLYLSFHLDLPAGPAMTLVATGIFGITAIFRTRLPG